MLSSNDILEEVNHLATVEQKIKNIKNGFHNIINWDDLWCSVGAMKEHQTGFVSTAIGVGDKSTWKSWVTFLHFSRILCLKNNNNEIKGNTISCHYNYPHKNIMPGLWMPVVEHSGLM